jgi:hypothetical protein
MINIHHRLTELSVAAGGAADKAREEARKHPAKTRTPGQYPYLQVSLEDIVVFRQPE